MGGRSCWGCLKLVERLGGELAGSESTNVAVRVNSAKPSEGGRKFDYGQSH